MKWTLFCVVALLFLGACAEEELPPSPPPPGGDAGLAGKAMGGFPVSGTYPSWAVKMVDTDVSPTVVKEGDKVIVTIESEYAYAIIYVLSKYNIWEKVYADTKKSGKITQQWARDKAVFEFSVSAQRLQQGKPIPIISYGCKKKGKNDKGQTQWDCNGNSNKWGLGFANFEGGLFPELIQKPIVNNDYITASKTDDPWGTLFKAEYKYKYSPFTKVDVLVLELKNANAFKQELTKNYAYLGSWMDRGTQICGYLKTNPGISIAGAGYTDFSWWSNIGAKSYWLTVRTYANTVDDEKVYAYVKHKYVTDCNLDSSLKTGAAPICGNKVREGSEECDYADDKDCPGLCTPDCTCLVAGSSGYGDCGDGIVQKPNSKGNYEDCEYPASTPDPVTGQVKVASSCFVRDNTGKITGTGGCDRNCKCDSKLVPPTKPPQKPFCGNGKADAGEDCGDPGTPGCPAGNACFNCKCGLIPANCGNGVADAGEQCDWGKPGVPCPPNKLCSANCVCADIAKCGNGRIDPGESCEKPVDCPPWAGGAGAVFLGCVRCTCLYLQWPWWGFCGNGFADIGEECGDPGTPGCAAGEQCDVLNCRCVKKPKCGDGVVQKAGADGIAGNADDEDCEKPGDGCAPTILAGGGAVFAGRCNANCKCIVDQAQPCPKKDCPKPDGDIQIVKAGGTTPSSPQPYVWYGFGNHYTLSDTALTQCWDECVSRVITDTYGYYGGPAPFEPITCLDISHVSGGSYQITELKSWCKSQTEIVYPLPKSYTPTADVAIDTGSISRVASDAMALAKLSDCPLKTEKCPANTICVSTQEGAACVPGTVSASPVPTPSPVSSTPTPQPTSWYWLLQGACRPECPPQCPSGTNSYVTCSQPNQYCANDISTLTDGTHVGNVFKCVPSGTFYQPPQTGLIWVKTQTCGVVSCPPDAVQNAQAGLCSSASNGAVCQAEGQKCAAQCIEGICSVFACTREAENFAGEFSVFDSAQNYATGQAFRISTDVVHSRGVQVAFLIIASLAILLVTLVNFVHHEE